jgi:hypothetical protein
LIKPTRAGISRFFRRPRAFFNLIAGGGLNSPSLKFISSGIGANPIWPFDASQGCREELRRDASCGCFWGLKMAMF